MEWVQVGVRYTRDDIYYCDCCGFFYDRITDKLVHVGLEELPAVFALEVMADRQKSDRGKQLQLKRLRKPKGFQR